MVRFDASRAEWIERLFGRLAANYGSLLADRWAGVDPEEVKRVWAHQLDGMPAYRIAYALAHLPKWPPTLPEFRVICSEAPLPPMPASSEAIPTLPRESEMIPPLEQRLEILARLKAITARMTVPHVPIPDEETERRRQMQAIERMRTAPAASTTSTAEPAS